MVPLAALPTVFVVFHTARLPTVPVPIDTPVEVAYPAGLELRG